MVKKLLVTAILVFFTVTSIQITQLDPTPSEDAKVNESLYQYNRVRDPGHGDLI